MLHSLSHLVLYILHGISYCYWLNSWMIQNLLQPCAMQRDMWQYWVSKDSFRSQTGRCLFDFSSKFCIDSSDSRLRVTLSHGYVHIGVFNLFTFYCSWALSFILELLKSKSNLSSNELPFKVNGESCPVKI